MKCYDFEKAKELIAKHGEEVKEASLGMHEDWTWTAETIFEDGEFTQELKDGDKIAGINGSGWATPVLEIEFKDGRTETFNCFKGESTGNKPSYFSLGVLSSPCQELRDGIEVKE